MEEETSEDSMAHSIPDKGAGALTGDNLDALVAVETVLAEQGGVPSLDDELGDGSPEAVAAFVMRLEACFLGGADERPLVARHLARDLARQWTAALCAPDDTAALRDVLAVTLREGPALLAALDAPTRWGGAGPGRHPRTAHDLALFVAYELLRRRYPDEPVTATRARLGGSGAAEDSGADRQIREAISRAKSWCGGSDEK